MDNLPANVSIAPIAPEVYKKVAALHLHIWRQAYGPIFGVEALQQLSLKEFEQVWQERLRQKQNRYLGIWLQGELLGFTGFGPVAQPHVAEISHFYLHPNCWGGGYATVLMQQVLDELEAASVNSVVLWVLEENYRAQQFYMKWGFTPSGLNQARQRYGFFLREVQFKKMIS